MCVTLTIGKEQGCESLAAFVKGQPILLVTGNTSYKMSGAEELFLPVLRFADLCHPIKRMGDLLTLRELDEILNSLPNDDFARIVGVGGGAILDTAKILALSMACKKAPSELVAGGFSVSEILPVFAIPTTAGSGAEATHFAVAYENTVKHSISHPQIRPVSVALIPELTFSLTPYQMACTGFDAVAQGIESLWAKNSTEVSRDLATRALEKLECIEEAIVNPDPENRLRMLEGAYLAGSAINISRTTAAHALSYGLTSSYGIPHGHAVAMVFPYVAKWNLKRITNNAAQHYCQFFDFLKIPILQNLPDFCVSNDIPFRDMATFLFSNVNLTRLDNNPVKISLELFEG